MTTALQTLTNKLASRFDMGDGTGLTTILKGTAFKVKEGTVSDDQMAALLVVANQYGLNPFTKEIFAYPDKNNGIVPVVSVDGWSRIINEHPQFDGIEFRYSEATLTHKNKTAHEWIECVITRKDRRVPIVVREYFDEVVRALNFATPWDSHPKRMHRHKAMIQCSRIAFGFAGIFDPDEAERIIEINPGDVQKTAPSGTVIDGRTEVVEFYSQVEFDKNLPSWKQYIAAKKKTAEQIIATVSSKAPLTDEQKKTLRDFAAAQPAEGEMTEAEIAEARARELAEATA
jgi:phage recombination protein Bet